MTNLALVLAAGAFMASICAIIGIYHLLKVTTSLRESIRRLSEAGMLQTALSVLPSLLQRPVGCRDVDGPALKKKTRNAIRSKAMAALANLGASETSDDEELDGIDYEGVLRHLRGRGFPV